MTPPTPLRVAELCAGYGGLFRAIQALAPHADLSWYAEIDPDASRVMAHHHPDAPNHRDITKADWAGAAPIDVLAGGWPCQPFSQSGRRAGSTDERHLWPTGVLPAITALQPRVFLGENVPGLLTIERGTVFRQILGDLNAAGYTTRWTTLGACKLGYCHHRHRLFILATREIGDLPPEFGMPIDAWSSWPRDGVCSGGLVWAEPSDVCGDNGLLLPTPTTSDGGSRGSGLGTYQTPEGRPLREVVAMLPTPTAHCADRGLSGPELAAERMSSGRRNLDDALGLLPTPRASDGVKGGPNQRGSSGDLALPAAVQPERWGQWAAAIARHAAILGRPAPEPTIVGKRGGPRLNPQLTEWMMALPAGHITGPVPDANAANRIAGNGVVPPAAAVAYNRLIARGRLDIFVAEAVPA